MSLRLSPDAVRRVQSLCMKLYTRPTADLFSTLPPIDRAELTSVSWLSRTLCDQAAQRTRLQSSSKPARPYI